MAPKTKKSTAIKKNAFSHNDGETLIDPKSHATLVGDSQKELQEWGAEHLSSMKKDEVKNIPLYGAMVKVRKVGSDLYSGWVEKDTDIIHKFERSTMPQIMMQLQSQLELYGKDMKDLNVVMPAKEFIKEHEHLAEVYATPTKEDDKEEAEDQAKELEEIKEKIKEESEADKHARIKEKLDALRAKVGTEVVSSQEIMEGLANPVHHCEACESAIPECSCYQGLSKPRVEFDGKKLVILFKSDWNNEDRDNFKVDLASRVWYILNRE